jgi:glycine/D-amino acid oxidase-like deaminating enzyme
MSKLQNKLRDYPFSLWREHDSISSFLPLKENISTDVTIIGAGITGITAAYLLAKEGLKVVLLEAGSVTGGTTGFTTAKISSQHGLIYDELLHQHGKEKARLYYDANQNGLSFIKKTMEALAIECDYNTLPSVVYAASEEMEKEMEAEANAYLTLGIDGGFAHSDDIALPYSYKSAVVMQNQAQFHPVKYLQGLLREFTKLGGKVFEQTRAVKI